MRQTSQRKRSLLPLLLCACTLPVWLCSNPADRPPMPPLLTAMADTTVAVRDTVALHVTAQYEAPEYFVWQIAGGTGARIDTTRDTLLQVCFDTTDTGLHAVTVQCRAVNGTLSELMRFSIDVRLYRPVLVAPEDQQVPVRDSLTVSATVSDTNGTVVHCLWVVDSDTAGRLTASASLALWFDTDEPGAHRVIAWAVDDDGLRSAPDTFFVAVALLAPTVTAPADTVIAVYDTLRVDAAASDSNGPVVAWLWDIDNGAWRDTTDSSIRPFSWTLADTGAHRIRVAVADTDGVMSPPDSFVVRVLLCPPMLTAMADTAVWINDTARLHCAAADSNGTVRGYVWEHAAGVDTTDSGSLLRVWPRTDTGIHELVVYAFDDDSVESNLDTIRVRVDLGAPSVRVALREATVSINDTLVLHAAAADTNGTVVRCLWSQDGFATADTTAADSLALVWRRGDTGRVVVRVRVADDDTLESPVDSCVVQVGLFAPVLTPIRDTLLDESDSLTPAWAASDSGGAIVMHYLDTGSAGWDDSARAPQWRIPYDGGSSLTVVWGARDDDSTLVLDTFVIAWNHAPDSVDLFGPIDTALVWGTALVRNERRVRFSMRGYDVDTPIDTLTFTLALGRDSLPFDTVYRGTDTFFVADTLDTGFYRWQLQASDLRGLAVRDTGSFVVIRERRICFLGHSILVGLAGNNLQGGFRREVMDSMRTRLGRYEKLRPMGHMLSYMMQPPELDSCLGRSGAVSYEMWDTLRHATWVNADCWVMMLGVNGDYNWSEQRYSQRIIDTAIYRNTECEVHFLNGLPIPDTLTWPQPTNANRDVFNVFLELVAQTRRDYGYNVNVVDAFSVLSVDSVFNDTLMSEYLHPNQLGYDRLAKAIWQSILTH